MATKYTAELYSLAFVLLNLANYDNDQEILRRFVHLVTYHFEDGGQKGSKSHRNNQQAKIRDKENICRRARHDIEECWPVPCGISFPSSSAAKAIDSNVPFLECLSRGFQP